MFSKACTEALWGFWSQSTIIYDYLKSAGENSTANNRKLGHNRWQTDELEH